MRNNGWPALLVLAFAGALAACDGSRPAPAPPPAPAPAPSGPSDPTPAPAGAARTVISQGGADQSGWFLCDSLDVPTAYAVGQADAGHEITIFGWPKAKGAPTATHYQVGEADPGAGQVYYSLSRGGTEAGNLHSFNPGALDDPASALTPTFTSMKLGEVDVSCRWLAGTRFLGFDGRRSFLVTQDKTGVLTYQTFDFASQGAAIDQSGAERTSTPSLTVKGGAEAQSGGATAFTFDSKGYRYVVTAPAGGAATVAVSQGGAPVQTETLFAYTYAPARR